MESNLYGDLSPEKIARLEKWRKHVLPVKTAQLFKKKPLPTFVSRKRDYGDDLKEFQIAAQEIK